MNRKAQAPGRGEGGEAASGHGRNLLCTPPTAPAFTLASARVPRETSSRNLRPGFKNWTPGCLHPGERTRPWRLEASFHLSLGPGFLTCKSWN